MVLIKNGAEFNYFSRNLKQVQAHKVSHLKEFIPKAFPNAKQVYIICGCLFNLRLNRCGHLFMF